MSDAKPLSTDDRLVATSDAVRAERDSARAELQAVRDKDGQQSASFSRMARELDEAKARAAEAEAKLREVLDALTWDGKVPVPAILDGTRQRERMAAESRIASLESKLETARAERDAEKARADRAEARLAGFAEPFSQSELTEMLKRDLSTQKARADAAEVKLREVLDALTWDGKVPVPAILDGTRQRERMAAELLERDLTEANRKLEEAEIRERKHERVRMGTIRSQAEMDALRRALATLRAALASVARTK